MTLPSPRRLRLLFLLLGLAGFFGGLWTIYPLLVDTPLSESAIRSRLLRLAESNLKRLTEDLSTYHQPPANPGLTRDPLAGS